MTRINILGASGSGCSTASRAVSERLKIPYFDCDDYFHAPTDPPFQRPRSPQERCGLLLGDLNPIPSWVLAGGVAGWDPYPELHFTLIVFLWIPTKPRLDRLREREGQRYGSRIQSGGDMHDTHQEFIEWASRYDIGDVEGKTLPVHERYLAEQSCNVLELRGERRLEELVDVIVAAASDV